MGIRLIMLWLGKDYLRALQEMLDRLQTSAYY